MGGEADAEEEGFGLLWLRAPNGLCVGGRRLCLAVCSYEGKICVLGFAPLPTPGKKGQERWPTLGPSSSSV